MVRNSERKLIKEIVLEEMNSYRRNNNQKPLQRPNLNKTLEDYGLDGFDASGMLNNLQDKYRINWNPLTDPIYEEARKRIQEQKDADEGEAWEIGFEGLDHKLTIKQIVEYIEQQNQEAA